MSACACVRACVRACLPLSLSRSLYMHPCSTHAHPHMDQVAVLRPEVAAVYRSDRARFDETAAEWTREYAVKAGGSAR
jgi:hypothetical protein